MASSLITILRCEESVFFNFPTCFAVVHIIHSSVFGITLQALCDLEPIYTYEGTYDINSLITGREITGLASFKPAMLSKRSRM
jgi:hypothetical protein